VTDLAGYLVPLLEIIGVNLVLSGDNAVVIALAVRKLPPQQQRPALLLSTGGAIVLHVLGTLLVTSLLYVPFLLSIGGLSLLWIAYMLLKDDETDDQPIVVAGGIGSAVRTILIADCLMSLDNTLAVAGVSQGHPVLIIIGLSVSIAIIMTSSLFLSRLMHRYPVLVVGVAGVLAWTAGQMVIRDAALQHTAQIFFRADLTRSPLLVLLSPSFLVFVLTSAIWRMWNVRARTDVAVLTKVQPILINRPPVIITERLRR